MFCPLGPLSFTMSFRMSPKGSVVLQLLPCGWCLCIVQNQLQTRPESSLLPLADHRELPLRPWVQGGREVCGRPWEFEPFLHVTYLCLQGLLRPDLLYTTLIWWWSAALHTQLYGLIGSSGHIVIWWSIQSIQSLLRPSSRPRAVSQKRSSYLWRTAGLCSKILRACAAIHL